MVQDGGQGLVDIASHITAFTLETAQRHSFVKYSFDLPWTDMACLLLEKARGPAYDKHVFLFSPSPWAWLVSHPFTCQGYKLCRLYHPSLKLSQHQGCGSWKNHFLEIASSLCNDRVGLKLIKVCMRTLLRQKMGKNDWNLRSKNCLDGCSTPMLWCK